MLESSPYVVNWGQVVLPYWFLFLIPAIGALHEAPPSSRPGARKPALIGAVLLFSIMIGFRYQVGGDWYTYADMFSNIEYFSFLDVIKSSEPGYFLLNWIVVQAGGDVWIVNLFCGLLFSIGLAMFARNQPRPWLALLIAVPYLVIVVAMGYSRQGVAIGFAMMALTALDRDQSNFKFILYIILAACFHKTAVALAPIAALSSPHRRIWTFMWLGIAALILYYVFLSESVDQFQKNYLEAEYQSQGAAIRVAMNAVPAVLFLLLRQQFKLSVNGRLLWTNMSLVALALVPLLLISPSSTAVDRMALYAIPLQVFVFSRVPDAMLPRVQGLNAVTLAVVGYCALVQFVWLNFGQFSSAWVPYQFYPLL